jgi:MoxR-like ATPase
MTTTLIRDKFAAIAAALEAETVNRQDEIEAINVAIVAKAHVFMLSKPGNGKTMLGSRYVARITGIIYFYLLLSKWTADQEMFGPWSLVDLKTKDVYHRKTRGYLPEAQIAFVDEIWKGSSAMTNALLGATNERQIRNGADMVDIPLSTLICASNELPDAEHDQCAAIYDRLDVRLEVDDVVDADDKYAMLSLNIDPNPLPILTWDEVLIAQAEAAALPLTPEARWAIVAMTVKLEEKGIRISGRRMIRCEVVARGAAWLAGADKVEVEHLEILRHMLWDTPEQRPVADKIVAQIASPMRKEILEVADRATEIEKLFADVLALDKNHPDRGSSAIELRNKAERNMDEALDLEDRASGRAARDLATVIQRLNALHSAMCLEVAGMAGVKALDQARRDKRR